MRLPGICSMPRCHSRRLHLAIFIFALIFAAIVLWRSAKYVGLRLQSPHKKSSSKSRPWDFWKNVLTNASVPHARVRSTIYPDGLMPVYRDFWKNRNGNVVGEFVQNPRVLQSTTPRYTWWQGVPQRQNKNGGGKEAIRNLQVEDPLSSYDLHDGKNEQLVPFNSKPSLSALLGIPVRGNLPDSASSTVSVNPFKTFNAYEKEPLPDVGQEPDTSARQPKIEPMFNSLAHRLRVTQQASFRGSSSNPTAATNLSSHSVNGNDERMKIVAVASTAATFGINISQGDDLTSSTPSGHSEDVASTWSVPPSSSANKTTTATTAAATATTTTTKATTTPLTTTTTTATTTRATRRDRLTVVPKRESVADIVARLNVRRPQSPHRLPGGPWQVVDGGKREVYLMTAYLDERPLLDRPRVTVIGLAEPEGANLYCLFWYTRLDAPTVRAVNMIPIGQGLKPRGLKTYKEYLLTCELPDSETPERPTEISIVTGNNAYPTTLLPVQQPVRPASPSDVIEFGHCMSILYWKQDPYRVVEWIELHRLWGVREFNFYTHRLDNATLAVLERYSREGLARVELVPPVYGFGDNESAILTNMSPVINDCAYRNLYRYRYVVVTDMDEMIVPRQHDNYSALIDAVEASRALNVSGHTLIPAVAHSYIFRNAYFFFDFGPTSDDPWYSTALRYQRRVKPSKFGYSAKSITRPLSCVGLHSHLCWKYATRGGSGWNADVGAELGLNQHYKRCHFDAYLRKRGVCERMIRVLREPELDRSMERFRERLVERVDKRLEELGLDVKPRV